MKSNWRGRDNINCNHQVGVKTFDLWCYLNISIAVYLKTNAQHAQHISWINYFDIYIYEYICIWIYMYRIIMYIIWTSTSDYSNIRLFDPQLFSTTLMEQKVGSSEIFDKYVRFVLFLCKGEGNWACECVSRHKWWGNDLMWYGNGKEPWIREALYLGFIDLLQHPAFTGWKQDYR